MDENLESLLSEVEKMRREQLEQESINNIEGNDHDCKGEECVDCYHEAIDEI